MNTHKAFDEPTVKFYACEILVMLEALHENNIIYRDLKPENILIDVHGHLKLADFGLAKIVESTQDLNDTFCGSPEYMAPEMLLGDKHNNSLDFYTFGCLLHEMVSEYPPFYSKNKDSMKTSIMFDLPEIDFNCSKELKHLIRWCLSKNIEERPSSVKEIMKHPFFKKVNWELIRKRKISPPWVPSLVNHFSKKLTKIPIVNNQISKEDNSLKRFDSRTSVYFEKSHYHESDKYLNSILEVRGDTSEYMVCNMTSGKNIDTISEDYISRHTIKTNTNRRGSHYTTTYVDNFEMENEPIEEIQFKKYLKNMVQKGLDMRNSEKQHNRAKSVAIPGYINQISSKEAYENGIIPDSDESPKIRIQSLFEDTQEVANRTAQDIRYQNLVEDN